MVLIPHASQSSASQSVASQSASARNLATLLSPAATKLSPTKIALFGVGRWGTHLLRNFLAHPQAEVVAVIDPDPDRLQAIAQQFELDDAIELTSDWEAALKIPGLEAVVIATPAATHYRLIHAALQNQLHVLAEKPLTLDPVDAIELCCLAASQQRQLVIDHTYLFHPAVSRGQLEIPQLGELRYGYASRTHLGPVRSDVDALWDLAIHDIAIFNHWLNQVPVQVQAQGKTWLQTSSPDRAGSPDQDSSDQGLSDLVWVKLVYPDGFQASIHLCWSNPDKQRRLCVVGSQGTLVFDELSQTPLTRLQGRLERQQYYAPIDQAHLPLSLEAIEPLQAVCTHFLDCVQTNTPSQISSGWLGAELVQILAGLTRSLTQNGQPVALALRQS